jgi:putative hydrolase of the HAD superfamily
MGLKSFMMRAYLFDLDETLIDREATVERYLQVQYARFNFHGLPYAKYRERFWELDARGYADRVAVFQALIDDFSLPVSTEALVTDFRQSAWAECQPYADVDRVLRSLRAQGYPLGIISNGSSQSQRAKLKGAGLEPLVDVILISEEEGIKKPDPAIFLRASTRLAVRPEECVFVGDNPQADIVGALSAGMQAVWRRNGAAWPSDLPVTAHYTIDQLEELLALTF